MEIPALICNILDRPVKAIFTVDMLSLLEQTDSTVYKKKLRPNQYFLVPHTQSV